MHVVHTLGQGLLSCLVGAAVQRRRRRCSSSRRCRRRRRIVVGCGGACSSSGGWCQVDSPERFVPSVPGVGWFVSLNQFLHLFLGKGILALLVPFLGHSRRIEQPNDAMLLSGSLAQTMQFVTVSLDVIERIHQDQSLLLIVQGLIDTGLDGCPGRLFGGAVGITTRFGIIDANRLLVDNHHAFHQGRVLQQRPLLYLFGKRRLSHTGMTRQDQTRHFLSFLSSVCVCFLSLLLLLLLLLLVVVVNTEAKACNGSRGYEVRKVVDNSD